jgi:enoyl-CoA hydratase
MSETPTQDTIFERHGPVAWLTFNRPEQRNAMTFAMYEEIVRVCDEIEQDPDIRVLVLTGAGERAFVAGTDINQFKTFTNPEHAIEYEARIDRVVTRLETVKRPTIAMIQGYAVGGGAALAMACDLRIVAPNAKFGVPISRTLGNTLSSNGYARVVNLIGPARTKEMIFLARMWDAQEALSIGLANEIVEPDKIRERVQEIAETIAGNAPITIQVCKESVRYVQEHIMPPKNEELLLKAYMSEDFKEGVSAFLEKRKPQWKGR